MRRRVNVRRHIYSLLITFSVFSVGFFSGYFITQTMVLSTVEEIENMRLKIMGGLLQPELTTCALNITRLNEERYSIGKELEILEREYGENDRRVLSLKENYMLLMVSHVIAMEKFKEECDGDVKFVIFFYSNEENKRECLDQGIVLTAVYLENPDVSILSVDVDIDNPAVKSLVEKYGIDKVPSIVVGGKVYEGFVSKDEVERLIGV